MADVDNRELPTDLADEPEDYNARRITRMERFRQLGGGKPLHEDVVNLGVMPTLANEVTDKHREMVMELAGTGMSQETAAKILGISKERLQTLFDKEWEIGFDLHSGDMQRTIRINAKLGDSWSAVQWLRYHPRSRFSDKMERTDKGAEQEKDINADALKTANELFVASVIGAMATDPQLKREAIKTLAPPKAATIEKVKAVKPKNVKRIKGD